MWAATLEEYKISTSCTQEVQQVLTQTAKPVTNTVTLTATCVIHTNVTHSQIDVLHNNTGSYLLNKPLLH